MSLSSMFVSNQRFFFLQSGLSNSTTLLQLFASLFFQSIFPYNWASFRRKLFPATNFWLSKLELLNWMNDSVLFRLNSPHFSSWNIIQYSRYTKKTKLATFIWAQHRVGICLSFLDRLNSHVHMWNVNVKLYQYPESNNQNDSKIR